MTDISVMEQCEDLAFMRYPRSIPKRYEETRSAKIQDFTHRRIICYGSEIQKKVHQKQEEEKKNVVRRSEEEIWQQAEILKEAELKKLREHLKVEHEKNIKKIRKGNEQALKEEALKVEMQMQKLTIQQVKEERTKGEEALAEAIKQAEEIAALKLQEACSAVRKRERESAEAFVTNLMEKHTKEITQVKKAASEDKKNAILQVIETKEREKQEAVQAARLEEQDTAATNLEECKTYYENELKQTAEKLAEQEENIKRLEKELAKSEYLKKAIENQLLEVRIDYQKYIERTTGLNRELTDIFMPSVYLDEVEKEALREYQELQNGETVDQATYSDQSQNAETDSFSDYIKLQDTDTTDQ